MKINYEYMKGLLEAFESSELPYTDIIKLKEAGYSYEENEFAFHLQILKDQNLIIAVRENDHGIGYNLETNDEVTWAIIPLRLTSEGHDFLSAIRQTPVWEKIKSDFQGASIETTIEVAKELALGWAKKKVETLLRTDS